MSKRLTFITLEEKFGLLRKKEPITWGVSFPKGVVKDTKELSLLDPQGNPLPCQWKVFLRWTDRSIKWVLCDFLAELTPHETKQYRIALKAKQPKKTPLRISKERNEILIHTGFTSFRCSKQSPWLAEITLDGKSFLDIQSTWQLLGNKKDPARFVVENIQVEDSGPVRCTVATTGHIISKKQDLRLWFYQRLSFFSGLPLVKVELTVRNPRRAKHKGGLWDLGDPGSMYLKDLSLILKPSSPIKQIIFCTEPRSTKREGLPPLKIYQDSSGGELWQSPAHVNRDGIIPLTFRGYRLKYSTGEEYGLRATPLIKAIAENGAEIAFAMTYFWQNFPKALEVKAQEIRLGLFPEEFADLHEIQGGEQKTHVFWLAFGSEENPAPDLSWVVNPLVPILDPEWISQSKALLYFLPEKEDHLDYLETIKAGIKGENSFFTKREKIDEYGWRNFGDVYADHETTFHKGKRPLVSHYNNQYDLIYSFLFHFLRSEDPRWFQLGLELATHVYDIDIYHTNEDKPAYNNGLFWHTFHYVDAGRSTHRCYSRDAGVVGGGPSNEHLYSSGLLLYYFLTGDPRAKEAVINFGEHVIEMDKPLKILRWLDKSPSGLASQTRDPWYHGPGRGAGNSINCLLDAYVLTGEEKYLNKAEELIRRCIHPKDDIEARGLRRPEERWSYTVFLQVLGKYLFLKMEWQQLDYMFAYARASLLHYARWMAENEYFYLDKPELLEYPTETWAAQEIRKAEVFNLAAYFANHEEERRLFRKKATWFYKESLKRLLKFPTWSCARPLAIVLSSGFSYTWFERANPSPWPEGTYDFGEPQKFVPQKLRIKQKFLRWLPRIRF